MKDGQFIDKLSDCLIELISIKLIKIISGRVSWLKGSNSSLCWDSYYHDLGFSWFTSDPLGQRFSNFFEVGTTFISQNNSADHLTLVPFKSKFLIILAYFNTSILIF
jgi:hypothetical protein